MVKKIRKRDGRIVDFDSQKISNAIEKAMSSTNTFNPELCKTIVSNCTEKLNQLTQTPTVEQIQDLVENTLIEYGLVDIAKNYILYRAKRTQIREMNTRLMKTFNEISETSSKDSEIKKENANINGDTPMGMMLKFGTEATKDYFDKFVLQPQFSQAHKSGDIHIHDLDFYTLTTTCCQIDLIKLFKNGFSTGHGFVREPNDIKVYSALACIAIQSNQNDQHGGQSVPNFDYAMALGVQKTYAKNYTNNFAKNLEVSKNMDTDLVKEVFKTLRDRGFVPALAQNEDYDKNERQAFCELSDQEYQKAKAFALKYALKETNKDCYQAMEALLHNLNTMHSRAGAQVPFSSLNFGTDTSPEGRMVIKNFLLATDAGLGNGETAIFPISIFKVKEGINYNSDDPNYDLFKLAIKVSSKRLFPNFSFIDAPFNLQYYKPNKPETEVSYMGCRTRVMGNTYDKNNEITFGRGNLSFTSINLPRLALKSNKNTEEFFKLLQEKLNLVTQQLKERFKIQSEKSIRNFPFLMGQGVWIGSETLGINDKVGEILKHGTLSVGFIGLAEALVALTGAHHGQNTESQKLGLQIVGFMRNYLDKLSEEQKLNYSLIATPAEGLSGRFIKIDNGVFGKLNGITDKEYYTNSFHVPVYHPISAFDKINIEAPYHELTNAGHITYVELDGDMTKNPDAFEKIIRHMKNSGIGYGSVNHPVDRDPVCGYTGILNESCPKCGRKDGDNGIGFDRIRRITGYLVGTLDRFNSAKKAEVRDRLKHNV